MVDTTRGIRERRGRTWVFDPQNVAGEAPTWFWNPLDMVAASMKEAASVAGLIAFTQRQPHMRTDAYFDAAALHLVTVLLFAASADGRPITDILRWLHSPMDDAPVRIMRAGGHDLAADSYEGMAALPGAQQAGVFGAARQYMAWLAAPEIREWITPGEGREQFRFDNFATETTDTLYILSRSDDRTATPAVGTLTAAVVVAAAVAGGASPGAGCRSPCSSSSTKRRTRHPFPFGPIGIHTTVPAAW
ncbi:type IV secretory system conjugative DNA transfer family protein [Yinghuangia aomiensis]